MGQTEQVRDIGGHKELFIDEAPIAALKNVRLTMNSPYQDHEPVLLPETPWEYRIHPYATVMKEGDTFRMWYLAYEWDPPAGVSLPVTGTSEDAARFWQHTRGRLCYAESDDGVHWVRPNLGLVEFRGSRDNNILGPSEHDPIRQAGWNGGTVFKDPTAPPERQYKLWSEIKVAEEGKSGLSSFYSADGLQWTPYANNPIGGHCDCLNVVFWDERIQQYVGYSRLWTADSLGDRYRAVRRLVSPDFLHWQETGAVLAADEIDLAIPVNRQRQSRQIMDFHGNCVFKYPGTSDAYLALPEVWWHWSTNPFPAAGRDQEKMGGFPDTVDVQLATSRDGIQWQRAGGRNPFLRLGPPDAGDSKMIYAFTQPVQVGDELWIYYGGFRYGISEGVALKRGAYFRARLRLDGFISADAPYEGGELVTVPLRFQGERLQLNADTSAGGAIRVQLEDESGDPLAGYDMSQADEVNGNSVRHIVSWGGRPHVGELAGRVVRLRFLMNGCKLYSFQFVGSGQSAPSAARR
jgi:hypothetical protein